MSGWLLWAIAACALGVGERLTRGFVLAPFAVGAALAAILELAGAGALVSWIVFVLGSILVLVVVRPVVRSRKAAPAEIRTGAAALVGKEAVVLERIANFEGVGCIRIDGAVWTARAYDDDHVIEQGTRVEVIDIKGATALVAE